MLLTEHQKEALAAYSKLASSHPRLFQPRAARPIVLDPEVLAQYASEHDVVLGVAADTPHVLFILDLVESHTADGRLLRYPYLRVISRAQLQGAVNVVVIATIEDPSLGRVGDVVLIQQERHALGTRQLELPRGFGEIGLTGEQNALRELQEETGYIGERAALLGSTFVDSGLTDTEVSFYHVPATKHMTASPESSEAIHSVILLSREQTWARIRAGELRDGFTVQALALLDNASLKG